MARTFDDLLNNLTRLEQELKTQLPKIVEEYAQNAQALVIHEIQQGEGVPNARYSTAEMIVTQSVFLQKAKFKPDVIGTTLGRDENGRLIKGGDRTKKGNIKKASTEKRFRWIKFKKAKKAVPVMTLLGGYEELRRIQGLQTANVDLTYSGRMLQNVKVLNTENRDEFYIVAIIGGINQETKDKLLGNYNRFGDYLAITPAIADMINDIPVNRVRNIIQTMLG